MENKKTRLEAIIEQKMDEIRNGSRYPTLCAGYQVDEKNQIGAFRIECTYEVHPEIRRMEWGEKIIAYNGKKGEFLTLDSVENALQNSGDTYIDLGYNLSKGKIFVTRKKWRLLDSYTRKADLLKKEIREVNLDEYKNSNLEDK